MARKKSTQTWPMAKRPWVIKAIEGAHAVRTDITLGESYPFDPKYYANMDWDQLGKALYEENEQLHRIVHVPSDKWRLAWHVTHERLTTRPTLGDVVYLQAIRSHQRKHDAIGQLIDIDRMPRSGAPRRYEFSDGGPADFYLRYTLRTLSGKIMRWHNVGVVNIVKPQSVATDREIVERRRLRSIERVGQR